MYFSNVVISLMLFSAAAGNPAGGNEPGRGRLAPFRLDNSRITQSFDANWRFQNSDAQDAEKPEYVDSSWRRIDVPHDWSIEGPFDQNNHTGRGGGYLPAGIGWYRKHFSLPKQDANRRVFIEFDGVMANSDVWINGHHLGKRPYGYVSFRYDITEHLNFGNEDNVLAVRVDNSVQPASRWYTGAGIYRHVRLVITSDIYIDQGGTFVWINYPVNSSITELSAVSVHAEITVVNKSNVTRMISLQYTVSNPDGSLSDSNLSRQGLYSIPPGQSKTISETAGSGKPKIWDLDNPHLYRFSTVIYDASPRTDSDGNHFDVLDGDTVTFGIREAKFVPATGFWLNGKNIKLKGVCLHHDAGGLGAAVPKQAWIRRFEILKQLGCNAVRAAHNPPSPEFLDAADQVGMLVMDEMFDCWTVGKSTGDYHLFFKEWSEIDTRDTVRRDRNHPSVILYSAGNEIHDTPKPDLAKGILKSLVDVFHANDPTQPVTQALFRPNQSGDYTNGLADLLDVVGTNYRSSELLAAQQAKPTRKIINTEDGHTRSAWLLVRDNPALAGQFLWTGIDYLGEAQWPNIAWGDALIDRTGAIRPMGYERQSWWAEQPVVHIARIESTPGVRGTKGGSQRVCDWTPRDPVAGQETNVEVYSNCQQVELVLNGKSLGSKPRAADDAPRTWRVPFEPGTIKALGSNDGKTAATDELHTAGKPAKIVLTAESAKRRYNSGLNFEDVCYVTAVVADENGVTIPWANDLITFKLSGLGIIAAVDNGDIASHEPFQASQRHAYQGRCIAIIQTPSDGQITLTASAPGLSEGTVSIQSGRN
jgi:beta-galactosidase